MKLKGNQTSEILDLEPFLQKCLSNDRLKLVESAIMPLLQVGENFSSDIVKIDVTIRRNPDSEVEKLHLVGKTVSTVDQPIISWSEILPKEVFVYTDLIPMYQSIERKAGVKDVIDILPSFIGHRFSLDDSSNDVDENGLLLMENLKVKGYFNGDKHLGVNVPYAKKTLSCLARYHALGVIAKSEYPDFFNKVYRHARVAGIDYSRLDESYNKILENIQKISLFDKHMETIKSCFSNRPKGTNFSTQGVEPWITVIHGDFWMNNILFHVDQDGNVDDVKFVDFQLYSCNNPSKDVLRFLCCHLNEETLEKHFDTLIDYYYEEFIKNLKIVGFNTTPFSRESFDGALKSVAVSDFLFYCLTVKFLYHKVKKDTKDSGELISVLSKSEFSEDSKKRLLQLLTIYERHNWF